jgi:hypothetical protein
VRRQQMIPALVCSFGVADGVSERVNVPLLLPEVVQKTLACCLLYSGGGHAPPVASGQGHAYS